jgi:diguanylate cyclase (GGDEF)-like protein
MSNRTLIRALLVFAVAVVAASVWFAGRLQRDAVTTSYRQQQAVEEVLVAMLDQETGLRGFRLSGREEFLAPYHAGEERLQRIIGDARRHTPAGERTTHALVDRSEALASRWHQLADDAVALARVKGSNAVPSTNVAARKTLMDDFRAVNERLARHLEGQRARTLDRLGTLSVLLILGLSGVFALGGWLTLGRREVARTQRERRDAQRRERQGAFARALQFMDSEEDTHSLLKRHLEQSLPASDVVVLQRNNSADRLEPATPIEPASPLAVALVDATPRSCMAARLGSEHAGGNGGELLSCELCGKTERELTTCTPLLVHGEVIGSVLVAHDEPLDRGGREYVTETVTQAAPVIANMRNLAIAELRAATDALTGLANRRAIHDTLRRMVAQANRSDQPLAAVAVDLDHFKQINDRFGHDKGDDVLAATSQALTGTLRVSDFVGRQGGEEFIVLLPDTGIEGALIAAENLRQAIARITVEGCEQPITASLGVAVYPTDAPDADGLLRMADRALYSAKDRGRNRVEAPVLSQIAG